MSTEPISLLEHENKKRPATPAPAGENTAAAVASTSSSPPSSERATKKKKKKGGGLGELRDKSGFKLKIQDSNSLRHKQVDPEYEVRVQAVSYTHLDVYKRQHTHTHRLLQN